MTRAEVPPDLQKPTDAALAAFEDLRQALLAPPILVLSMAQQFHLSVLTRLSIGTHFWVLWQICWSRSGHSLLG